MKTDIMLIAFFVWFYCGWVNMLLAQLTKHGEWGWLVVACSEQNASSNMLVSFFKFFGCYMAYLIMVSADVVDKNISCYVLIVGFKGSLNVREAIAREWCHMFQGSLNL